MMAPKVVASVVDAGQPKVTVAPQSSSDAQVAQMISLVAKVWDVLQEVQAKTERDIADLRQQQNLLANRREDQFASVSGAVSEIASLKQRLGKIMSQAESQLHVMEKASVPSQLQKQVEQLQVECNWLYSTVLVSQLHMYLRPTTTLQPSGVLKKDQRILILYKTVENEEGLWMQLRQAKEPEKRYWIRLVDSTGTMTIGDFAVTPT